MQSLRSEEEIDYSTYLLVTAKVQKSRNNPLIALRQDREAARREQQILTTLSIASRRSKRGKRRRIKVISKD